MRPIEELSRTSARSLTGLLFDLDDTLLDEGKLSAEAYAALFALRNVGLELIAVTGRPASFAEVFARTWPIDGAVAENGALAFRCARGGRLEVFETATSEERRARRTRLETLVGTVRSQVPELVPADDAAGRRTDFTFDIGEHERPSESAIEHAIRIAAEHGARTTRSSVHLHLGYDWHDKATGTLAFLGRLGHDPTVARARFCYVGDSTNDAPCFAAFSTTVGVANLSGRFSIGPRFVTRSARTNGFLELARQLESSRRG